MRRVLVLLFGVMFALINVWPGSAVTVLGATGEEVQAKHSLNSLAPAPPTAGYGTLGGEPLPFGGPPGLVVELSGTGGAPLEVVDAGKTTVAVVSVRREEGGELVPVGGAQLMLQSAWYEDDLRGFAPGPMVPVGMTAADGTAQVALSPQWSGVYVVRAVVPGSGDGPGDWGATNVFSFIPGSPVSGVKLRFLNTDQLPPELAGFQLPPFFKTTVAVTDGPYLWTGVSADAPALLVPAPALPGQGATVVLQWDPWHEGSVEAQPVVALSVPMTLPAAGGVVTVDIDLGAWLRRIDAELQYPAGSRVRLSYQNQPGWGWVDFTRVMPAAGTVVQSIYVLDSAYHRLGVHADCPAGGDFVFSRPVGFGAGVVAPLTLGTDTAGLRQLTLQWPEAAGREITYNGFTDVYWYWVEMTTRGEPLYIDEDQFMLHGIWTEAPEGSAVWRYVVDAVGWLDLREVNSLRLGQPFSQGPLWFDGGDAARLLPPPFVPDGDGSAYPPNARLMLELSPWWGLSDANDLYLSVAKEGEPPAQWQWLLEADDGVGGWSPVGAGPVRDEFEPLELVTPPSAGIYRLTVLHDLGPLYGELRPIANLVFRVAEPETPTLVSAQVRPVGGPGPIVAGDVVEFSVWVKDILGEDGRGLSGVEVTMVYDPTVLEMVADSWSPTHLDEHGNTFTFFPGHWLGHAVDAEGNPLFDGEEPVYVFDAGIPVYPEVVQLDDGRERFSYVRYLIYDEPNVVGSGMLVRWQMKALQATMWGPEPELRATPPGLGGALEVDLAGWDPHANEGQGESYGINYLSAPTRYRVDPRLRPITLTAPRRHVPFGQVTLAGSGTPYEPVALLDPDTGQPLPGWGWCDYDGNLEASAFLGPDGVYRLVAKQKLGDQTMISAPVEVVVDRLAPFFVGLQVTETETEVTIAGTVSDASLRDLWVLVGSVPGTVYTDDALAVDAIGVTPDATGAFAVSVPKPAAPVVLLARDLAGNHTSLALGGEVPLLPPAVVGTMPYSDATGVALNTQVTVAFNKPIDTTTFTFTLVNDISGEPVAGAGTWDASNLAYTFTPGADLEPGTAYTATVSNVVDTDGLELGTPYSFSFTTATVAVGPVISHTVPAHNATGVTVDTSVEITFSRPMNTSPEAFQFVLSQHGTPEPVAGTGAWNTSGDAYVFTPDAALAPGVTYLAAVPVAEDTEGNALPQPAGFMFTTAAVADTTPPTIVSTVPGDGATGVPVATSVTVVFSEPINTTTFAFVLVKDEGTTGVNVVGSGSWNSLADTFVFVPAAALEHGATYAAAVISAYDLAGNPLSGTAGFSFQTAAAADTTPPGLVATVPAHGATGVPVSTSVVMTFSEAMDTADFTFTLTERGTSPPVTVAGTGLWSSTDTVYTFVPGSPLGAGKTYDVEVSAKDKAGNALPAAQSLFSFTTEEPAEGVRVYLDPASKMVGRNSEFTIDVMVEEVQDLAGVTFEIAFDPLVLQVVDADPNTPGVQVLPGTVFEGKNPLVLDNAADNENGTIRYTSNVLNEALVFSGTGSLARIQFRVNGDAQLNQTSQVAFVEDSDLAPGGVVLGTLPAGEISIGIKTGASVTVIPGGILRGVVQLEKVKASDPEPDSPEANHSGIVVSVWSGTTKVAEQTTGPSGAYEFALEAGTYTVKYVRPGWSVVSRTGQAVVAGETLEMAPLVLVIGDMNGDSYINVLDLLWMAQCIGQRPSSPDWATKGIADVNGDTYINVLDLLRAAQNIGKRPR